MNYRNTLLVLLVVFVAWAAFFYAGNKPVFDKAMEKLQSLHPPHHSSIPPMRFDGPKCKDGQHYIEDVSKLDLLYLLWKYQWPASFYASSGKTPPPFDWGGAYPATKGYIDYYAGRAIKADLSAPCIDCRLYERDSHVECGVIIEELRSLHRQQEEQLVEEATH